MKNRILCKVSVTLTLMVGLGLTNATANMRFQSETQQVTLFSRATYKDNGLGRSAFSFQYALRSDDEKWSRITRKECSLYYGSVSIDHDSDWFSVSMGGDNPSRIKDLGAMAWSEIVNTPFLPANPRPESGIRLPAWGESTSSDESVTKVIVGHIYVVHIKKPEWDYYAMFTVDSLERNDHCTISWKRVPSPE